MLNQDKVGADQSTGHSSEDVEMVIDNQIPNNR